MFDEFVNNTSSGTSGLSFFINKIPRDDLLGAEIGISKGACACILLQSCPTIKKLDLVDSYKPHSDIIEHQGKKIEKRSYRKYHNLFVYEEDMMDVFSGLSDEEVHEYFMYPTDEQVVEYDEDFVEQAFREARYNLFSSGFANKCKMHVVDSNEFLKKVPDNYYDFIFLDAHLSYEQIFSDLKKWLPKVKDGGIISGHDYYCLSTWWAVRNFRKFNNIEDKLYRCHNDTFLWYKNVKNGIMGL